MQSYPRVKTSNFRKLLRGYGTVKQLGYADVVFRRSTNLAGTDTVTLGPSPQPWKLILAQQESATSLLKGYRHSFHYETLDYGESHGVGVNRVDESASGFWGGGTLLYALSGTTPIPSAYIENVAAARFAKSYKKATQAWDGGAFVAELTDLRGIARGGLGAMAGATLSSFKGLQKLWKSRGSTGRQLAASVSNLYLEWQFAIAPLASDLANVTADIDGLIKLPKQSSIRVKGSGGGDTVVFAGEKRNLGFGYIDQYVTQTSHMSLKYVGVVVPSSDPLGLRRWGFHGDNGISSIWEAIPFSFLADYVSNIQEILDSKRFWWTTLKWVERGVEEILTTVASPAAFRPNPYTVAYHVTGGGWTSQTRRVLRLPYNAIPQPTFEFEIPGGTKIANIAALVAAISGNKAPPFRGG